MNILEVTIVVKGDSMVPSSERCQTAYPDYKNGARLPSLVAILPSLEDNLGTGEAYGTMSMGFYNGRGVYGTREAFFLPPFLWIFFQGRQSGTVGVPVNGKVGLRARSGKSSVGLRLFQVGLRARSGKSLVGLCGLLTI